MNQIMVASITDVGNKQRSMMSSIMYSFIWVYDTLMCSFGFGCFIISIDHETLPTGWEQKIHYIVNKRVLSGASYHHGGVGW